jgi:hypothetical protein
MLKEVWSQETLPQSAQVEIWNYTELKNGKLIFLPDEEVIGEYNPNDPDGGRSILGAATVTLQDGTILGFSYREKWWTGLQVSVKVPGEKYFTEPDDFGCEEFPLWAEVQE